MGSGETLYYKEISSPPHCLYIEVFVILYSHIADLQNRKCYHP